MELHFCTFPLLSLLLCAKKARLSMKFIDILCRNITFITNKYISFSSFVYSRLFLCFYRLFSYKKLTCGRQAVYNMVWKRLRGVPAGFASAVFQHSSIIFIYGGIITMENKNMGIAPLVLGIVSVVFAFIVPIVGLICGRVTCQMRFHRPAPSM